MKSALKIGIILFVIFVLGYFVLDFIIGAGYDEQHWTYRKGSRSSNESIERGVFVKSLNFKIDSFSGRTFQFEVFIEKAFTHGYKSAKETLLITNTDFPFTLSFNSRPMQEIGVYIRESDLSKFDSCDAVWGFLKHPELQDTITLEILGEGIKSGVIIVW